ncbi:MAG TPA: hypothetical protein VM513_16930 [Kofleriaceae bacterium]|jgi:hypothetical protein|nr:hypothetical protein [Kofleriaceae bacterium]
MNRTVALLVLVAAVFAPAPARADEDFGGAYVIFARGGALYRTDPKGKAESKLVDLPAKVAVRALRTDSAGDVLLADLGGKWSWMRLDGKAPTALTELPCADGPAQLAVGGDSVICRSTASATGSLLVNLATHKASPIAVPPVGTRLVGVGTDRRVIWADATGVWSAPALDTRKKAKLAPEAPLRSFLPSPDGRRALGVYLDKIHEGKQTKPAELLMGFALDGTGARRKAIKMGVPVEWSHDNQWVLVQDRASSCIMSATGGQYKCWKGYTSASIAADGRWSLVLGNRDRGSADGKKAKKSKKAKKGDKKSKKDRQREEPKVEAEPSGEAENAGDDTTVTDDVEVAPPTGPLALYRTTLAGPYSTAPALIVRVVDGAAVWIPGPPRPNL